MNEANAFLRMRYPNIDLELGEVNRSVNRRSSGSVLNLWSDREKHRYLWSTRQDIAEGELFSNLKLAKKSQSSTLQEVEFELTSFFQIIKKQILAEKQSNKGGELEEVSEYFFSGI